MNRLLLGTFLAVVGSVAGYSQEKPVAGDDLRDLLSGRPFQQADIDDLSLKVLMESLFRQNIKQYVENPKKLEADLKAILPDKQVDVQRLIEQAKKGLPVKPPESPTQTSKAQAANPLEQLAGAARRGESPDFDSFRTRTDPKSKQAWDAWLEKSPAGRNLRRVWERNMGSLDRNPAFKKMLSDLLNSSMSEGSGPFGTDDLTSLFDPETPLGRELSDWLDQAAGDSSWDWSGVGFGDWNWHLPESGLSAPNSSHSMPISSSGGGDDSLAKPLLVLAAVVVAVIVIRRYGLFRPERAARSGSQAALTALVDPNAVADRETLVKAFESITLHAIGGESVTWNHRTIADEFGRRVAENREAAEEAARLYEMARYAHPSESLPPEAFAAARRCLGQLREARPR